MTAKDETECISPDNAGRSYLYPPTATTDTSAEAIEKPACPKSISTSGQKSGVTPSHRTEPHIFQKTARRAGRFVYYRVPGDWIAPDLPEARNGRNILSPATNRSDAAHGENAGMMPLLQIVTPTEVIFGGRVPAIPDDLYMNGSAAPVSLLILAQNNRDACPSALSAPENWPEFPIAPPCGPKDN